MRDVWDISCGEDGRVQKRPPTPSHAFVENASPNQIQKKTFITFNK